MTTWNDLLKEIQKETLEINQLNQLQQTDGWDEQRQCQIVSKQNTMLTAVLEALQKLKYADSRILDIALQED